MLGKTGLGLVGGGLSARRKVKSSSRLVVSPGSLWNTVAVITDERAGPRLSSSASLAHSSVSLGSACAAISLMTPAPLIWPRSGETGLIVNSRLTQRKTTAKCIHLVILLPYQQCDAQLTYPRGFHTRVSWLGGRTGTKTIIQYMTCILERATVSKQSNRKIH